MKNGIQIENKWYCILIRLNIPSALTNKIFFINVVAWLILNQAEQKVKVGPLLNGLKYIRLNVKIITIINKFKAKGIVIVLGNRVNTNHITIKIDASTKNNSAP